MEDVLFLHMLERCFHTCYTYLTRKIPCLVGCIREDCILHLLMAFWMMALSEVKDGACEKHHQRGGV